MHILVCVKHIPDPEAPWVQFRIDEASLAGVPMTGVRWLMSPFDELALEAALRLRDAHGIARITVLTLGAESSRAVLRHGLAMGADDGVLLCDPAFEGSDAWSTAAAIAAAVRKLGEPALVLTGRQAADGNAGIVGSAIGELLRRPIITFAAKVELAADDIYVERVVEGGIDIVQVGLPAVVTVSNELGQPRSPNLRETMRAARKPIQPWSAADLDLQTSQMGRAGARTVRVGLFAPAPQQACEYIGGATVQEQATGLVARLRAARLI